MAKSFSAVWSLEIDWYTAHWSAATFRSRKFGLWVHRNEQSYPAKYHHDTIGLQTVVYSRTSVLAIRGTTAVVDHQKMSTQIDDLSAVSSRHSLAGSLQQILSTTSSVLLANHLNERIFDLCLRLFSRIVHYKWIPQTLESDRLERISLSFSLRKEQVKSFLEARLFWDEDVI